MIRQFTPYFFSLLLLWPLAACNHRSQPDASTSAVTAGKPNIIYILVDDMGYGDLSCYSQQLLQTPNIDQLAADGMRFTRHYSGSTVCGPSRAALLTGKHTGHTTVRGNQPSGQLLAPETTTLAEALKAGGYVTGMAGKWGIGHPPPPDDPLRNGFDQAFGYINMWHAHNFYPEFLYRNGQREKVPGNITDTTYNYARYHPNGMPEGTGVARVKEQHTHPLFEEDALNFIEANRDTSFFLYLALNIPHANNEAGYFLGDGMEVPTYGPYADRDWPQPEKGFAAMIDLIDGTVGRIRDKVQSLGLDKNTLIVFTSDNGPHQEGGHQADFFDSNGPLRGTKRDLYEGGIRMPTIASWPGTIAAGSTTDHISAFWDVLPTFCELAGVAAPEDIDGISFLPTLLGTPEKQRQHQYLYWEFYEAGGKQAVLEGDWKLVRLHLRDDSKAVVTELYHLADDLGETRDLADENPEKVAQLERYLKEAHTPFPGISLFDSGANAETAF
ncbi:arylsulfatase [Flavilitoribacter nigricans]|uniref:N-acetylgalactosamine-6-sulfatase n=1 Tax=Flavilitoribacter nigricans (strain ATCC 23147 / DSM 23189 / NBRC 102662 / NCIMB 1420 / SS-2) TaxID=1122177 RepID=A0A2D0N174_FLAN2|nr:arylsulfatase [Flavilitoribacter nigricans]PHN02116.1 N-acetylgalactosamine-6-sulfatase [Flavilitoribacter nigricans DSM 23189 = NBRC 102662]